MRAVLAISGVRWCEEADRYAKAYDCHERMQDADYKLDLNG